MGTITKPGMDTAGARPAADPPIAATNGPATSWRYRVEARGAALFFAAMGWLPIDAASALGGALARRIGPWLGISKRARHNLKAAMPELSAADAERIVRGMWDNLGRVAAEYPHLREIAVFPRGDFPERIFRRGRSASRSPASSISTVPSRRDGR